MRQEKTVKRAEGREAIKRVKFKDGTPYIVKDHKDGYSRKYFGKIDTCKLCKTKYFSVYRNAKYCSCTCLGRYRTKERNPSWRGGRSKVHGYTIIFLPMHPYNNNGYVREHRLVMEKYIQRYLSPSEDVHHINGTRDDNRIENLMLLKHGKHSTLTNNKRWGNI